MLYCIIMFLHGIIVIIGIFKGPTCVFNADRDGSLFECETDYILILIQKIKNWDNQTPK